MGRRRKGKDKRVALTATVAPEIVEAVEARQHQIEADTGIEITRSAVVEMLLRKALGI